MTGMEVSHIGNIADMGCPPVLALFNASDEKN
jgi:hypothetical protein